MKPETGSRYPKEGTQPAKQESTIREASRQETPSMKPPSRKQNPCNHKQGHGIHRNNIPGLPGPRARLRGHQPRRLAQPGRRRQLRLRPAEPAGGGGDATASA